MKVQTMMQITELGDRVTTKIYHDGVQVVEAITLEMAGPQSFSLEARAIVQGAYQRVRADRQKNWPGRG